MSQTSFPCRWNKLERSRKLRMGNERRSFLRDLPRGFPWAKQAEGLKREIQNLLPVKLTRENWSPASNQLLFFMFSSNSSLSYGRRLTRGAVYYTVWSRGFVMSNWIFNYNHDFHKMFLQECSNICKFVDFLITEKIGFYLNYLNFFLAFIFVHICHFFVRQRN